MDKKIVKNYIVDQESWFTNMIVNGELINEVKNPTLNISCAFQNEEGILFEFDLEWLPDIETIQLQMMHDSWKAFNTMPEFFKMLSEVNKQKIIPDIKEFTKILDELGFVDVTEREK